MAKVVTIPAKINAFTKVPIGENRKRRVAAYARVSTDKDEQYTSYESQIKYYTEYIQKHPEWEFSGMYADEGITGTCMKRRDSFKKMVQDALDGKIDLIITKSISRFARNTVDTLNISRQLRRKNVEIYFEKENLWTFDAKSEMVLTVCASLAQEESRSISANVTMGKKWKMERGETSWAYKSFLGYKKINGEIVVVEDEAEIIKFIYRAFLRDGWSCTAIADSLTKQGVPTPMKKERWSKNNIISILTNEKYYGDALLQKTFTVDFLEHKVKKNEGELPQYLVTDNHPGIILKSEWEQTQAELVRRREKGFKFSATSIFSSKLICGDCGGFYGKKVWHSNDEYRKEIYQCNKKYNKDQKKCQTPIITEEQIKEKFVLAFNELIADKEMIIQDTLVIAGLLADTNELDEEIIKAQNEIDIISETVKKLVKDNGERPQSQEEYNRRYNDLVERYNLKKKELDSLQAEKKRKKLQRSTLDAFIDNLKNEESIVSFDDKLWILLVDSATIYRDGAVKFKFANGLEMLK